MGNINLHKRAEFGVVKNGVLFSTDRYYSEEAAIDDLRVQLYSDNVRAKMRASYMMQSGDESVEGFEEALEEYLNQFEAKEVTVELEKNSYYANRPANVVVLKVNEEGKFEGIESVTNLESLKAPVEECIDVYNATIANGGATYNPKTKGFVENGFVYGSNPNDDAENVWIVKHEDFSPLDILQYIREHGNTIFDKSDCVVGTWINEGLVYIEMVLVSEFKDIAVANALVTGQKAIFDLNEKKEIALDE